PLSCERPGGIRPRSMIEQQCAPLTSWLLRRGDVLETALRNFAMKATAARIERYGGPKSGGPTRACNVAGRSSQSVENPIPKKKALKLVPTNRSRVAPCPDFGQNLKRYGNGDPAPETRGTQDDRGGASSAPDAQDY